MPRAEVTLPGLASSVPAARRFVETLLSSWGHPEAGWTAAICVSELGANCALHARTDFSVLVELGSDAVRLEVSDGSSRVPLQRAYGEDSTTGRGLRLLEAHATRWGVDVTPAGKTVWVLIALPPVATAADLAGDDAAAEVLLAAFGDGDPETGSAHDERLAA